MSELKILRVQLLQQDHLIHMGNKRGFEIEGLEEDLGKLLKKVDLDSKNPLNFFSWIDISH